MAAQNEAHAAGNDLIRPGHLVLGLLSEPRHSSREVIVAQGVPPDTVRQAVTAALPPAAGRVPALIPFDQQAKKALELSFREALRMGHNYVGTEHICSHCWNSKTAPECSPDSASTRRPPRPTSPPPWPPCSPSASRIDPCG